ncbi:MAG: hypothetical protein M1823_000835 [Watsoniomyces obsoletus]|nr:MAG: hypothetical protein M1823_000835 [Watsoniomyces obsoletus]
MSDPVSDGFIYGLVRHFSSQHAYRRWGDVKPFFNMLRDKKSALVTRLPVGCWPWDRIVCGIVSNTDDRLPAILHSMGLSLGSSRFYRHGGRQSDETHDDCDISFMTLSYDVDVEKPDPQIFVAAKDYFDSTWLPEKRRLLGDAAVPPTDEWEFLHVGDDMQKDGACAREAGWNSILIDRLGRFPGPFPSQGNPIRVPLGADPQNFSTATATADDLLSASQDIPPEKQSIEVIRNLSDLRRWTPSA